MPGWLALAAASTKAFLARTTAAYLLGTHLTRLREIILSGQIKDVLMDLYKSPVKIQKILDNGTAQTFALRRPAELHAILDGIHSPELTR